MAHCVYLFPKLTPDVRTDYPETAYELPDLLVAPDTREMAASVLVNDRLRRNLIAASGSRLE